MKLNYHPDTDSLYIDLSEQTSVESREISEGIILDYDAAGNLVEIDIDNASAKVQLQTLTLSKLPGSVETIAGKHGWSGPLRNAALQPHEVGHTPIFAQVRSTILVMSSREVEIAALKLVPKDRARLAGKLLESLEKLSEEENEIVWAQEAERRDAAWSSPAGDGRSAKSVLRGARAKLK
jgi:uncharacterized protein YuzE